MADDPRLRVWLGRLTLLNPVICSSGEPVMTESGIRAALAAGAAGVIAKSVNEQPAAARQLDHADYAWLDRDHGRIDHADPRGALFCRSGLSQRVTAGSLPRALCSAAPRALCNWRSLRAPPACACSS